MTDGGLDVKEQSELDLLKAIKAAVNAICVFVFLILVLVALVAFGALEIKVGV